MCVRDSKRNYAPDGRYVTAFHFPAPPKFERPPFRILPSPPLDEKSDFDRIPSIITRHWEDKRMASNLIGNEAPLSGVASSNLVSSAFAIVWNLSNSKRFFYVFFALLLDFFSFSGYHIILEEF